MQNRIFFLAAVILFFGISISAWPLEYLVENNSERNCECLDHDCGCCEYVDLNYPKIEGKVCANFSYLPQVYGVSVTLTWNSYTLYNMTISARDPPPICFGIPDLENIRAKICLKLNDLTFMPNSFHGCGKIILSVYHVIEKSIDLGCIDIPDQFRVNRLTKAVHGKLVPEIDLKNLTISNKILPVVNMI